MATLHFIFGPRWVSQPQPALCPHITADPPQRCRSGRSLWDGWMLLGAVLMAGGGCMQCVGFWLCMEAAVELLGAEQGREQCLGLPEGSGS